MVSKIIADLEENLEKMDPKEAFVAFFREFKRLYNTEENAEIDDTAVRERILIDITPLGEKRGIGKKDIWDLYYEIVRDYT